MKTNIALTGFMGAGKTSIGDALARRLRREFIELDSLIEKKAGKPIPDIFSRDGEAEFRRLEAEITVEISQRENAVIACGGGIILNETNIDRLRQNAVIIYLEVPPEIILRRLLHSGNKRPLLNTPDREQRIRELMSQRQPLYEQAADIKITGDKTVPDTVEKIIKVLKTNGSIDI
jgi:shikimate kinase